MAYSAKVLIDSLSPHGHRLTTMEVTLPRIVLSEFNTHRMFSRNSASSRAIPVEKKISAVINDPFIPDVFGKNQKGMQAKENVDGQEAIDAELAWRHACANAINSAKELSKLGVHKQLANRLLEPFSWQTILVTATEWDNFFALRCSPDAQPEIRKPAELMKLAYEASVPKNLDYIEWHLPLLDAPEAFDLLTIENLYVEDLCLISAGRCARVSYLTHDGKRDYRADIELAKRLLISGHMSPFEHVARPFALQEFDAAIRSGNLFSGNFLGWVQLRKTFRNESNFKKVLEANI